MSYEAQDRIEREFLVLLRRAHKGTIQVAGVEPIERAAYAILGRLFDDGPMRLTAIATLLEVDVSTVSRQVQALVRGQLVDRVADPGDRRAALLELTARGREELLKARAERRRLVRTVVSNWTAKEREVFAALLERFNAGLATHSRTAQPPVGRGDRELVENQRA
jgi:DNA-binding MarR family transcriptional regulator